MSDLDPARLARLDETLAREAERTGTALAYAVARGGTVHVGATVGRDTIFRISSMTKPVTAVAAMMLVEEGALRLTAPVDEWLPELAERKVLAKPDGALDDTVPAVRPITVLDVLTFRLGIGIDFGNFGNQPVLDAAFERGLMAGPPAPAKLPAPDEWIARLGELPLERQPGERWMYHVGADVLGVLVARASGQPFDAFLRERIFEPLGMVDTGFSVPAAKLDRFGPCRGTDPATGEDMVYDPADGQWSTPPRWLGGGDGLVSTVDDYLAFGSMLRAGGRGPSGRLLARPTVELMATNQLTAEQLTESSPGFGGATGWGLGVGVAVRREGHRGVGCYGWDGGLGSSWGNDPVEDLTGVLLTDRMWSSPQPPGVFDVFWAGAYAAVDD